VVQNRKQWQKCKLQLPQEALEFIAFESVGGISLQCEHHSVEFSVAFHGNTFQKPRDLF